MKIDIQQLNEMTDSKMLLEYLIRLSLRVRELQKQYYKSKTKQNLTRVLDAEKIYDMHLNCIMLKHKFDLHFDKPMQYLQGSLDIKNT